MTNFKLSSIALCASLLCLCPFMTQAQQFDQQVKLTVNSNDGVFAKGDTIKIYSEASPEIEGCLVVTIKIDGKDISCDTIQASADRRLLFEQSFDHAAAGMVQVNLPGRSEKPAAVGFIVSPEDFKPGFDRPEDLGRFWKKQIRAMRSIPMDVQLEEVSPGGEFESDVICWQFIINGPDETPCRGYIAMPKGAQKHSLPIYFFAHAAGVSGGWCRARASHAAEMAMTGGGALAIDMNAHGIPDDMPLEYYVELEHGRLQNYSKKLITDHESYYFRTMFLRMVRALDYMCSRPEWDGRRVLVQGESQGGAQSAAVAGLDKRVRAVVLQLPAMFDIGGELAGRASGWPKPLGRDGQDIDVAMSVAPYYDCALLVKKSKAVKFVETGLIDTTCPATGIYAGMNGSKGRYQIIPFPYRAHTYTESRHEQEWRDVVLSKRIEFIEDYLK